MNAHALTGAAPHVRAVTSLTHIHLLRALALAPVLIAAVLNTGYQYLLALDVSGGQGAGGWQDDAIRTLGIDHADPTAVGVVLAGLVHVLPVLAIAIFAGGLWERVFANRRRRRFDVGVFYTAAVFTMLMPPAASLSHVAFSMSFAIIFAKGVFGGEGKSFLNPALVAAAVMQISFPTALVGHTVWSSISGYAGTRALAAYHQDGFAALAWMGIDWWGAFLGTTQGLMGTTSLPAVLVGAAVLCYGGIASWRLMAGMVLGVVVLATLFNTLGVVTLTWYWHLVLGSFAFCAVFIATDPASAASTDAGLWIHGLLAGALIVMIRVINPSHPDGVVPVLLLASMLAPLIDHVVVWFNVRRRARRHG